MRRYEAMPEGIKAERIEGVIYMAAATTADFHGVPHAHLIGWLTVYRAATKGVEVADNTTTRLDPDNDPQPDASLWILPAYGGRAKTNSKGYLIGSPELIVEVSGSTVSFDLNDKLRVYRRNGVQEYVVHRVYDGQIDWFVLKNDRYDRIQDDSNVIFRSLVFPGLWLNAQSLVNGDIADVLQVLQAGLSSAELAEFVKRLSGYHQK